MSIFQNRWLCTSCACGWRGNVPIRLMLMEDNGTGARTLAETVRGSGPIIGGPQVPEWSILLHAEEGAANNQ